MVANKDLSDLEIADEIDIAADDLRMRGVNLKEIKFQKKPTISKEDREWMAEFDRVRKRLLKSGKNLAAIPIVKVE